MSYYKKPQVILTNHAIDRINKRLKLSDVSIAQKYRIILDLFDQSMLEFNKNGVDYYKTNNKQNLYFIVQDNIIITITQISFAKKMKILNY